MANVHLLAGCTEAALTKEVTRSGAEALTCPATLEVEFKKPVLLPATCTLSVAGARPSWGTALTSNKGLTWSVDKKGTTLATGTLHVG